MPRIIFYHINKCAGTSLLSLFRGLTRENRIFRLELFKEIRFRRYDPVLIDSLMRADFIHDPYGGTDWKELLGNGINITWLRDPADRLISNIRMLARLRDDQVGGPGSHYHRLRDLARAGTAAFLNDPMIETHGDRFNGITRAMQLGCQDTRMLWESQSLAGTKTLQDLAMTTAMHNLAKMDFIGTVETFDEDVDALLKIIGRPLSHSHGKLNVDPARKTTFSDEERALTEPFVHIDRQIYNAALNIIAERKADGSRSKLMEQSSERYLQRRMGPRVSEIVDGSEDLFVGSWYACERNGDLLARWIGPQSTGSVAFHVEKTRDLYFRFRIVDSRDASNINDLMVKFDGVAQPFEIYAMPNGNAIVEGVVPAKDMDTQNALLWMEIDCGTTYEAADADDDRSLGLCIAELEVGPQEKYTLGAITRLPVF
jgi:Sulfotransferase family